MTRGLGTGDGGLEKARGQRPEARTSTAESRVTSHESQSSAESRVTSHESRPLGHEVARTTPVDVERVERTVTQGDVDVSVLVPAKDEAENLPRFMELAAASLGSGALRYEVIVIDDGSLATRGAC
jgi:hypothetical protein